VDVHLGLQPHLHHLHLGRFVLFEKIFAVGVAANGGVSATSAVARPPNQQGNDPRDLFGGDVPHRVGLRTMIASLKGRNTRTGHAEPALAGCDLG
jgi:hypothetical protein